MCKLSTNIGRNVNEFSILRPESRWVGEKATKKVRPSNLSKSNISASMKRAYVTCGVCNASSKQMKGFVSEETAVLCHLGNEK